MNQNDLNRAVSRATGESVATVKRIGFLLDEPPEVDPEHPAFGPHVIDWDEVDALASERSVARSDEPVAA